MNAVGNVDARCMLIAPAHRALTFTSKYRFLSHNLLRCCFTLKSLRMGCDGGESKRNHSATLASATRRVSEQWQQPGTRGEAPLPRAPSLRSSRSLPGCCANAHTHMCNTIGTQLRSISTRFTHIGKLARYDPLCSLLGRDATLHCWFNVA